ncbi:inactive glucose-6-phosphate 1-dehydrogenase 4, chloroplastic isoform X1 [Rosa rugosa]|uniref:inactive glucose-6-phosphate 1-dehydrogenase 4, chloroplastic isoform X1 n=2 Tax=Rosa rugosa TaxID=74645 RepID=UPI002B416280|nr:inactive glucose-6-phosphate 1-dehydrogenase 4, chloroplastic isoform X1 [Rosa rugosa]
MSMSFSAVSVPFMESKVSRPSYLWSSAYQFSLGAPANYLHSESRRQVLLHGGPVHFCRRFCGLKQWIVENLHLQKQKQELGSTNEFRSIKNQLKDHLQEDSNDETTKITSQVEESSVPSFQPHVSVDVSTTSAESPSMPQTLSSKFPYECGEGPTLCIAVIGATGELARGKIFPALFALYYSGFLPENVCIFGYSRKDMTDEDLRSMIASNLTCRVEHQQNCGDRTDIFLRRTYYINGGYDNREGMSKLNVLMKQFEGKSEANRIFYLSVPQEALINVACSVADNAQSLKGWNRVIIEKPFGFDGLSSHRLTQSLLSKFQEKQIYRIDHLLGRNLIENLTVLRFANLVFEPLWNRTYIRNVQVILSEDLGVQAGRYFDGYGIIRDIVHSHILQTIALLAMEPPISLDGEDIRNEKAKLLRSVQKLEPSDVILGQYKARAGDKVDAYMNSLTPTYFAAALYIDNARWDGVPFLIKTGMGLIKHRVEIRIQFHHVPGNVYRERMGHNIDLATNELILRDTPDEAILVRVNNKIPGLGLQLDSPELNLLYKDKYNVEVPDSYEQLLLDVVDGDSHLFLRSDELAAAWNILTPVLSEIDKKNIAPELYELGGRGPVGAYYLWAKHGVPWAED